MQSDRVSRVRTDDVPPPSLHPLRAVRLVHSSCARGWLSKVALLIGVTLSAAQAAPIRNPDNGHYYEEVFITSSITWDRARTAAENRTYRNMKGHLATVTSLAENRFIALEFPNVVFWGAWLGGFQERGILDPAAGWQWVTGEPWGYTNWNMEEGYEPNDLHGLGTGSQDENRLHFWYGTGGRWNDNRNNDPGTPAYGYIVEYEPDPSPEPPTLSGYASVQSLTDAVAAAPPGSMLRLTGANLGSTGTVLFNGIPLPADVARWTPTEIDLWVPTAPSYPFNTRVTVVTGGKKAEGSDFIIAAPTPGQDNLLANGSFEFPDSRRSSVNWGYTYGQTWDADPRSFRGYAIPGWRISEGTIDVKRIYWQHAPGQGSQSIDLTGSPGAATIHQTFFTERGKRYILSGYASHNPGVPDSRAAVFLNGAIFAMLRHEDTTYQDTMRWRRFSWTFQAQSAQTTVTFRDLTGYFLNQGAALDGLSVTLAP